MVENFDLTELASALDLKNDELFLYAGLSGLLDRYAIKNTKQEILLLVLLKINQMGKELKLMGLKQKID